MRILLLTVALIAATLALAASAAFLLAIERTPRLDRAVVLTPAHVERAKRIIQGQSLRRMRAGSLQSIRLRTEDVDTAANYLAGLYAKGSAHVQLEDGAARFLLSVPLPPSAPLSGYVNVSGLLVQTIDLPRLESVRVGKLPLPDVLSNWLLERALERLRTHPQRPVPVDALRTVRFSRHSMGVIYTWDSALPQQLRASISGENDVERLRPYQTLLADQARAFGRGPVSLAVLLHPMMRLAQTRSANGEAAAENRAALLVLTFHVLGERLSRVVPQAATWPRPAWQRVTLSGRSDLAKHFMVSAAIAAHADTALADAVGLYKEVEDARGGSGFSFDDLAADRAGARFGETATKQPDALQRRLRAGVTEADVMPAVADLPSGMTQAQFLARFGGIGAPAYQAMIEEIELRVSALPVLQ
jgi:hypothetical protein